VESVDGGGCSQYADPVNPETWHHYELHAASLVISCGQVRLEIITPLSCTPAVCPVAAAAAAVQAFDEGAPTEI
jgi:hypothetical protein